MIRFQYVHNRVNPSFEDHLGKVRPVIQRLNDAGLTINPKKITVASNHIKFLGHVVPNHSISIHPEHIKPIDDFQSLLHSAKFPVSTPLN